MNKQTKEGENCRKNKSSNSTNQNLVELRWTKNREIQSKINNNGQKKKSQFIPQTKHANVNIERPKS